MVKPAWIENVGELVAIQLTELEHALTDEAMAKRAALEALMSPIILR